MYKREQVETLFSCEFCLKLIIRPVTLPCGNNVCLRHLRVHSEQERFKCDLCREDHYVPLSGFHINKNIQKALENTIPEAEEVKERIEDVTKVVRELEVLKESPEGYIYDYYEEIKRKVDSRRETLKNEIDLCSDRMIERIESTRSECIQMNVQMKGISESLEVLEGKLNRIRDRFISLNINKGKLKKINKIRSELDDLESELFEKLQKQKEEILQNSKFCFEFDEICVESIFGDLRKDGDFTQLDNLIGHAGWVNSVAFDTDNMLASGSQDKTIKLWNKTTGDLLRTLIGHDDNICSVAFDTDNMLASGSSDETIKLWDKKTGSLLRTLTSHGGIVTSVAFDTDNMLASSSWDWTTSSWDWTIKLWDKNTGDLLRTLIGHGDFVNSIAFDTDNMLASSSWDKTVTLWDKNTGVLLGTLIGHDDFVNSVAFDTDNLLASSSWDNTVKLWNKNTGFLLRTLIGHDDFVTSVAFDTDNLLASSSWDNTVKLWDKNTGVLLRTLIGHGDGVTSVAFDTNNMLASSSQDTTIKLWNKKTGDLLKTFFGHDTQVNSVAFDTDNMLASGSEDDLENYLDQRLNKSLHKFSLI